MVDGIAKGSQDATVSPWGLVAIDSCDTVFHNCSYCIKNRFPQIFSFFIAILSSLSSLF